MGLEREKVSCRHGGFVGSFGLKVSEGWRRWILSCKEFFKVWSSHFKWREMIWNWRWTRCLSTIFSREFLEATHSDSISSSDGLRFWCVEAKYGEGKDNGFSFCDQLIYYFLCLTSEIQWLFVRKLVVSCGQKIEAFRDGKNRITWSPISPWWYPGGKDLQADSQQSEIQGGSWIHLIWLVIYWHMRQWKRVFYTDSSMLRHTGIAYDMICKTIHLINDRSSSDILHDIVHLTHTSGHDTIYMMIW